MNREARLRHLFPTEGAREDSVPALCCLLLVIVFGRLFNCACQSAPMVEKNETGRLGNTLDRQIQHLQFATLRLLSEA